MHFHVEKRVPCNSVGSCLQPDCYHLRDSSRDIDVVVGDAVIGVIVIITVVIVLFMYCLFNDVVSSSDYIALNYWKIDEKWNGKEMEGSGRGVI
jgi:hypothetical protein